MDKHSIMRKLLRKLANLNIWGGKHTEIKNLKKCLPRHLRGEKVAEQAIKELMQSEFIQAKLSTNEIHLSLNPRKKKEIYEFLSK